MNLQSFSGTEPIAVNEEEPIHSPIDGSILGFSGTSNRDGRVIVCREYRWPRKNGQQNYYRKLGGYTFNEVDLDRLYRADIKFVLIQEIDNDRVLEFELSQFINGDKGGHINGRQKWGVPVKRAVHKWTSDEAAILSASRQ